MLQSVQTFRTVCSAIQPNAQCASRATDNNTSPESACYQQPTVLKDARYAPRTSVSPAHRDTPSRQNAQPVRSCTLRTHRGSVRAFNRTVRHIQIAHSV